MKTLPIFLSLTSASFSASILWDPLPYFSEADSPFYQGILEGTIYLEDFEDQALNTPFVREPDNLTYFGRTYRSAFPNIPDGVVRSVDGDDGVIDFNGLLGDSWKTTNISTNTGSSRASFEFLPNDDGVYPTYVGIVITEASDLDRVVSLAFFDENNVNVSNDADLYDPKEWVPFPLRAEDTRTHRFVGFYHEEGIHRLALSNVSQVDHLQYGYAIPEPATAFLALTALLPLLRRNRIS
jgi:hypothetical protein